MIEINITTQVFHYCDVIMSATASQITSLTIVYSTFYSSADQRKHQRSASLAIVRGIHRWPMNSPHKWPVTRKMFPFDDVIVSNHLLRLEKRGGVHLVLQHLSHCAVRSRYLAVTFLMNSWETPYSSPVRAGYGVAFESSKHQQSFIHPVFVLCAISCNNRRRCIESV